MSAILTILMLFKKGRTFLMIVPRIIFKFASIVPDACTRSVYVTCSAKICGKYHYQPRCVLVTGCSNDGLPDLALLRTVVVLDSLKYFVNEVLNTCSFETQLSSGLIDVISYAVLYSSI